MPEDREIREDRVDYDHFPTIRGTGPKKLPPMPASRPKRDQEAASPEGDSSLEDKS